MTFDFVAPFYDKLARLVFRQALLTAQRYAWWRVPPQADVLILGGGTGALLPAFLHDRQPRRVLYLEASAAMLVRARQRVDPADVVTFRHGTEAALVPTEQFDAILLPFVLDLYPETTLTGQLIPRLLLALRPGGALYVTDFDLPHTPVQRAMMTVMLLFFRLAARISTQTLPNWPATLAQAGLIEQHQQTFRRGQLRAGCWVREPTTAPAYGPPLSSS